MRVRLSAWVLLLCLGLPAAAGTLSASGTATVDGHTLQMRSAYATWTPRSRLLRIVTLPFDLTPDAVQLLEKFPAYDYQVVESPPRPFLRLDLELDAKSSGAFAPRQVRFFNLSIWRPAGENANYSRQGADVAGRLTIAGDFRKGAPLHVEAAGEGNLYGGKRMRWNFRADCRVFVVR